MTGRTHDVAAFTALNYTVMLSTLPHVSLATVIGAVLSNLIGGVMPDIDQSTGVLWHKLPGGTLLGKLVSPFLGGHRHISHSFIGILLFGFVSHVALFFLGRTILINMQIVWYAFLIGYVSHLVMDTFTKEGVPWLFPLPIKFGIPPLSFLRIRTGGFLENFFVLPLLIVLNIFLVYTQYGKYLTFIHQYIK